jgi:hypothetical protein
MQHAATANSIGAHGDNMLLGRRGCLCAHGHTTDLCYLSDFLEYCMFLTVLDSFVN